jgi:glycine cleavage system H protein
MVKAGLKYTKDHEWVEINGNIATVGITDYASNALGSIVYVELPDVDAEFAEGESAGAIESVKAASDVYLPVSGKIVEVNEAVSDEPGSLNTDPFANWILKVEMSNLAEVDSLMDAAAYEALLG